MIQRLLTTTICLILCCGISLNGAEAALSSAIVWEIRPTGNANNGGGFKAGAGIEYSQQDAAQIAFTDLVIGNPTTTNLTSAANPFTSAHVGNVIKITGGTGFTTGYYEVVSVASNVATMDRSVGTAGSTGGTGNLGGASDHPDTVSGSVVAGNTIYIKNGTYSAVGANAYVLNTAVAGGSGTPISWFGYSGSRVIASGANRPIFDAATTKTNALVADVSRQIFQGIIFQGATGAGATVTTSAEVIFYDCKFTTSSPGLNIDATGNCIFCEANNNNTNGISIGTSGTGSSQIINSYVHDNSSMGISFGLGHNIRNTISESNSSHGFQGTSIDCFNNVAYNNTGASTNGFSWNINTASISLVFNNISISNGNYGFSRINSAASSVIFNYNLYNGNTTGGLNNITAGANDLTSSPSFTNAAAGDFTYSSSASPAIGAGLPQSMPGAVGDYNWNIGVDQGDHVTGGGSGYSRGRVVNQ